MIPELGYFALVVALGFSILLCVLPLYGAQTHTYSLMLLAPRMAYGLCLFTWLSYAALVYAYLLDNFSVVYVANNSSLSLPWYYKITATWGGHEGAMLLWLVMQSSWTALVARFSRSLIWPVRARVLAVLGILGAGFYLYTLLMSSPFESLLPYYPVDGHDLNPLLQDPGMIIHPPLLYMGYVGLSVSFSFAVASLLGRVPTESWVKWARPWTLAAWLFLTLGITIGSWWAYSELGWGGWWFWDPVENASLMPWLVATALLHSLAVTEQRKLFQSWTILLAITAFSLCLLGTFIVRSGVIVSVHAFASDPDRGLFILGFLALVVGGSLTLFALRAPEAGNRTGYRIYSKEVALWLNNIMLVTAMLVVLLGTLLPLIHKEIGLGSISIGAPFFNQMFAWLLVPFCLVLGLGMQLRWKNTHIQSFIGVASAMAISSAAIAGLWLQINFEQWSTQVWLFVTLAFWVFGHCLAHLWQRRDQLTQLSLSFWAMIVGHSGLAAVIFGVILTSHYSEEKSVRVTPGQALVIQGYEFTFLGVNELNGPNYRGYAGQVKVTEPSGHQLHLSAEKRIYQVTGQTMTEAAVDAGLNRDLYLALGEQLTADAWALRIYYKAYVRWIWLGGMLMALAGLLVLTDKRYRGRLKREKPANLAEVAKAAEVNVHA